MNHIKKRRQELGLSQTKLAAQIGIAQGVLSNLEHGRYQPWPKVKRDLSEALGVSEQELFENVKPSSLLQRIFNPRGRV